MESSRKCQADMIFIEWLSFCGTKKGILKRICLVFKMYILLGQTKRAVDHILLEFFVELYCTSMWAEFKNKKRSYLSEQ